MIRFRCPYCRKPLQVDRAAPLPSHSAFVTNRETVRDAFTPEEYHPDPSKAYKTTEAERRTSLAYYWRHRERILADQRTRRERVRQLLGKS